MRSLTKKNNKKNKKKQQQKRIVLCFCMNARGKEALSFARRYLRVGDEGGISGLDSTHTRSLEGEGKDLLCTEFVCLCFCLFV